MSATDENTSCAKRWDNAYLVDNLRRFLSNYNAETKAQVDRIRAAEVQIAGLQQELQDKKIGMQDKESAELKTKLIENQKQMDAVCQLNAQQVAKLEYAVVVQARTLAWLLQQERKNSDLDPILQEQINLMLISSTSPLELTIATEVLDSDYRDAFGRYETNPKDEKASIALESAIQAIGDFFANKLKPSEQASLQDDVRYEIKEISAAVNTLRNVSLVHKYRKINLDAGLKAVESASKEVASDTFRKTGGNLLYLLQIQVFKTVNDIDFKSDAFDQEMKTLLATLATKVKVENGQATSYTIFTEEESIAYQQKYLASLQRMAKIIRDIALQFHVILAS